MRMSCNSTYLLDKKTDHGVKADEMTDLLAEVFEDRQSKVVVFSQWVRMHELVVRRLERRKWGHVFFHGGVPGPQRKGLIQQFKEDPNCRLFLATDAGGVGLNLQNAQAVVNLDQPWNPAVLEQRIGRVHRLGPTPPGAGRAFHRARHDRRGHARPAGLQEIDVRRRAGRRPERGIPRRHAAEAVHGIGREGLRIDPAVHAATKPSRRRRRRQPPPKTKPPQLLRRRDGLLFRAATAELDRSAVGGHVAAGKTRADFAGEPARRQGSQGGPPAAMVARDEATGQQYLKLPLPDGDMMRKIADLLSVFTGGK